MSIRADIEAAVEATPRHKISKRAAGYKDGLPQAHCAICRHFKPPETCEIVKGTISPQAWCKYFERKQRKS